MKKTKPQTDKQIIKHQDQIIGKLTRENLRLRDDDIGTQEWIKQAKKDAGFSDNVSFDVVWKNVLNAYIKMKHRFKPF